MYRIDYEIGLNDSGRPCIDLPEDYEHKAEDRFFAIELARYVLQDVYGRRSAEFDAEAAKTIDITIRLLGQVGDNIAEILWNQMKSMGEVDVMLKKPYHSILNTLEELTKVGEYLITSNKIYKRGEGLKILISENSSIYEYLDGRWREVQPKSEGSSNES